MAQTPETKDLRQMVLNIFDHLDGRMELSGETIEEYAVHLIMQWNDFVDIMEDVCSSPEEESWRMGQVRSLIGRHEPARKVAL